MEPSGSSTRSRDGSSGQKARDSITTFWHKAIKVNNGDSRRAALQNTQSGVEFPPDRYQSTTVKFSIKSSPPRNSRTRPIDGYTR
uniref:Uncharacterized protein n=1 Tax=Hyaloperonospora arabidopsidis (strain Emoy2) TaxID=559515 RepID=M4B3S7_HYAAE